MAKPGVKPSALDPAFRFRLRALRFGGQVRTNADGAKRQGRARGDSKFFHEDLEGRLKPASTGSTLKAG